MATLLNANFLYGQIDRDTDVIMVGFADDEFDTQKYLLLQKSLLPCSDEDIELGFDKVHVTFCNELQSAYCDIERVILENGYFMITVTNESAIELGTENEIVVNFPKGSEKIAEIKVLLQEMFSQDDNITI